jgi:hypothetical protein
VKFELGPDKCPLPGGETALGFTRTVALPVPLNLKLARARANVGDSELRPSAVALQQPPGGPLARGTRK